MKQSEKLMQLLELMQANPELPVIPCVDGDVVGGDEYYCWLGSWGESAVQEFIIGKEEPTTGGRTLRDERRSLWAL
ncbi:MAG: hypothetical protein ACLSG5_16740 [Oscillospiraceae bacterium]